MATIDEHDLSDDSDDKLQRDDHQPPAAPRSRSRVLKAGSAITGAGVIAEASGLAANDSTMAWLVVGGGVAVALGLILLLAVVLLSSRSAPAARLERLIRAIKQEPSKPSNTGPRQRRSPRASRGAANEVGRTHEDTGTMTQTPPAPTPSGRRSRSPHGR